jgi:urease accessory protein
MLRAIRLIAKAQSSAAVPADTITLDRQSRYRRRVLLRTDGGHDLMLDLEAAVYMAEGDILELVDGGRVGIIAAPEPLLEIHVDDALALARIAWHIGNRHTPAEITQHAIYIQPDHVLEAMVRGHGARVQHVMRPFEPEGGAYGGKGPLIESHHGHRHDHHDHGDKPVETYSRGPENSNLIGKRIPDRAKKS